MYNNVADGSNCPCSSGNPQCVYLHLLVMTISVRLFFLIHPEHINSTLVIHCGMEMEFGFLEQDCCNASGLPWFYKVLTSSTTEALEMCICVDEGAEDSPIAYYEIFMT